MRAINFHCILCVVSVLVLAGLAYGEDSLTEFDTLSNAVKTEVPNAFRILYIGGSVTIHGTNSSIKAKLLWYHTSGMAASERSKDYAHVFAAMMQKELPERKVEVYITSVPTVQDAIEIAKARQSLEPHLVVLEVGSHEPAAKGVEPLKESYEKLLALFQKWEKPPVVLCLGPWSPTYASGTLYKGWLGKVEETLSSVCAAQHISYISVVKIAGNPAYSGTGEVSGVKWHPNDEGHAQYAEKLWEAYKQIRK